MVRQSRHGSSSSGNNGNDSGSSSSNDNYSNITKAARRDLPYMIATGGNASTTVAAAMVLAHKGD